MPPNAIDHENDLITNADMAPITGKRFSRAEVLQHHDRDDCMIIIRGKVYSVHNFFAEHPGGDIIMSHAGEDATDVFAAFHSPSAYAKLSRFCVGELREEEKQETEFVKDARKLRALFKEQGLFKSNKLYYAFKCLSNISILATSITILTLNPGNTLAVFVAGLFLALFWQQCGWLSHDFLHHQVFENRVLGNAVGFIFGNLAQGFSVDWWKNKHNTHHAVPNVHGGDPDIDTLPFLAWSEHALEGFNDPQVQATLPKFMIDHQLFFYTPLLTFARFSWALQSALHVKNGKNVPNFAAEAIFLSLHWIGYLAVLSLLCHGIFHKLLFLFTSQLACGVLLASVFSLNHNGMPIFSKEEARSIDFYSRQILTGRAVSPSLFTTWFTGGLNYQIEHHLFPMLPRHNFHKIQPLVESLCKKHHVTYHRTGFFTGTVEVFKRLSAIGDACKRI